MAFPRLRVPTSSRQVTEAFGGYNHNLRIGDGEIYDMKNLCSDDYPLLSTRKPRGTYASVAAPGGLIAKDALCYVDGENFVFNKNSYTMQLLYDCDSCRYGAAGDRSCSAYQEGKKVCQKQLISMGAYVIILPDKQYFNTQDVTDFGPIEAEFDSSELGSEFVSFSMCLGDGNGVGEDVPVDDKAPEEKEDGMRWIDTSTSPHVLKQWSEASGMWVQIASTYVKIEAAGIHKKFSQYDGISLSIVRKADEENGDDALAIRGENNDKILDTAELEALEGSAAIWDIGEDYIVIVGMLSHAIAISNPIIVKREMPVMDHVIECGNRLWGCRYGPAANGEVVNEIYCSKLGDFKNWNCFMGISTDSWVAGVGTDGPFTGAIAHMGYPLFFKENHLHKVYIGATGTHQIADTACRGVQKGCSQSLAIVGEVLYYKSLSGVCAYDGSLPTWISQAFGNVQYQNAVAGAHGGKYYVSMQDMEGRWNLFVYDTEKGFWHREDDLHAGGFCSCRGTLYCIDEGDKRILQLTGQMTETEEQEPVEWMAQSGMLGLAMSDRKYISRLQLRLQLPEGSHLSCWAEYDSSGRWVHLFTVTGRGTRAVTFPIKPVRCDHMRLRLEGRGEMKLFSITKTIEQGSDVR